MLVKQLMQESESSQITLLILHPSSLHHPITGSLLTTTFTTELIYEAISYNHYLDSTLTENIIIDDKQCELPATLCSAFKTLQHPTKDRALWIEALCFPKSTTSQLERRIHLLPKIFNHAKQVLIWLGNNEDSQSRGGFSLLNLCADHRHTFPAFRQELPLCHLNTSELQLQVEELVGLLNHPYWSQIWIMQEIMFAISIVMFTEVDEAPFHALYHATSTLPSQLRGQINVDGRGGLFSSQAAVLWRNWGWHSDRRGPMERNMDLRSWISVSEVCRIDQNADPRERVLALLNIACDGDKIEWEDETSVGGLWERLVVLYGGEDKAKFRRELGEILMLND